VIAELFLGMVIAGATQSVEGSRTIEAVSIQATGGIYGLYAPGVREVKIVHQPGGFYAGDRLIDDDTVSRLERDVERADTAVPSLASVHLTQSFFVDRREGCAQQPAVTAESSSLRALLGELCVSDAVLDDTFRKSRSWSTFNEGPRIIISLRYRDGRTLRLVSSDGTFLALPWTIETPGRFFRRAFDGDLSLAVAALVPAEFSERAQIDGTKAGALLGWRVASNSAVFSRAVFRERFGVQTSDAIEERLTEVTYRFTPTISAMGRYRGSNDTTYIEPEPSSNLPTIVSGEIDRQKAAFARIRRSEIASLLPDSYSGAILPEAKRKEYEALFLSDLAAGVKSDPRFVEIERDPQSNVVVIGSVKGYSRWALVAPSGAALLLFTTTDRQGIAPDSCKLADFNRSWQCGIIVGHERPFGLRG
jgi:hypothetical protein